MPITDWKNTFNAAPWMIRIEPNNFNNLKKVSAADCFQVRSISELRMVKNIGKVDHDILEKIKEGLTRVLSIGL